MSRATTRSIGPALFPQGLPYEKKRRSGNIIKKSPPIVAAKSPFVFQNLVGKPNEDKDDKSDKESSSSAIDEDEEDKTEKKESQPSPTTSSTTTTNSDNKHKKRSVLAKLKLFVTPYFNSKGNHIGDYEVFVDDPNNKIASSMDKVNFFLHTLQQATDIESDNQRNKVFNQLEVPNIVKQIEFVLHKNGQHGGSNKMVIYKRFRKTAKSKNRTTKRKYKKNTTRRK